MYFTIIKLGNSGVMGHARRRWRQAEQEFEAILKQVKYFLKKVGKSQEPGLEVHAFDLSIGGAEEGESL